MIIQKDLVYNLFQTNDSINSFSTGHSKNLRPHFCRTRKFSIGYRGPDLWNSISKNIRQVKTMTIFVKNLKNFHSFY